MDKKFRSRKFMVAMVSILGATGALLAGLLDGAHYAMIVATVAGLYELGQSFVDGKGYE